MDQGHRREVATKEDYFRSGFIAHGVPRIGKHSVFGSLDLWTFGCGALSFGFCSAWCEKYRKSLRFWLLHTCGRSAAADSRSGFIVYGINSVWCHKFEAGLPPQPNVHRSGEPETLCFPILLTPCTIEPERE